jgi:hypothetical protein
MKSGFRVAGVDTSEDMIDTAVKMQMGGFIISGRKKNTGF